MIAATDTYKAALKASHVAVTRATVLNRNQIGLTRLVTRSLLLMVGSLSTALGTFGAQGTWN